MWPKEVCALLAEDDVQENTVTVQASDDSKHFATQLRSLLMAEWTDDDCLSAAGDSLENITCKVGSQVCALASNAKQEYQDLVLISNCDFDCFDCTRGDGNGSICEHEALVLRREQLGSLDSFTKAPKIDVYVYF